MISTKNVIAVKMIAASTALSVVRKIISCLISLHAAKKQGEYATLPFSEYSMLVQRESIGDRVHRVL